jgi:hypothetical protein
MSAPFRIVPSAVQLTGRKGPDSKAYLDRLLKLIPAETVSLYLAGLNSIPSRHTRVLVGWLIVCLFGVIAVRAYGTGDKVAGLKAQWPAVIVSSIAFLIWSYSLGGAFAALSWYADYRYTSALAISLYTFVVPLIYTGTR